MFLLFPSAGAVLAADKEKVGAGAKVRCDGRHTAGPIGESSLKAACLLGFRRKKPARPSPRKSAPSPPMLSAGVADGWGLASGREEARNAKGGVGCDECDQDGFGNAHDVSPLSLGPPRASSAADKEKVSAGSFWRCDGRHTGRRIGKFGLIFFDPREFWSGFLLKFQQVARKVPGRPARGLMRPPRRAPARSGRGHTWPSICAHGARHEAALGGGWIQRL